MMGFFKRNPNESNYYEGKKHIIDVIKNDSPADMVIYKHPAEDFNTKSVLNVMPGETALFVNGGQIVQSFPNGRYELSTQNYPFISRLRNMASGGISSFNCVVYYVRSAVTSELRWGTQEPIKIRDKVHKLTTDVRVRAAYRVNVQDPSLFLTKLIGSNVNYTSQQDLRKYFISEFQGEIKSLVAMYLDSLQRELIGIEMYISDISRQIAPRVDEILRRYGLSCEMFSISAIEVDTSKYDEIERVDIDALKNIKQAQGERGKLDTLGITYGQERDYNTRDTFVSNMGNMTDNGVGSVVAGMNMGMAVGSMMNNMSNQMLGNMTQPSAQNQQPANNADDPFAVLQKLKQLFDAGLISQADYDAKKQEILSRM